MMRRLSRRLIAGAGLGAAILLTAAIARGALPPDARIAACGSAPAEKAIAAFDVAAARDLKKIVPGLAGAPELDVDAPVSVVVFDGPITVRYPGNPRASRGEQTVSNIVCVMFGDVPIYYANIDLAGWHR